MAKSNSKCVRISDDILRIVESCPGTGFNQKFENLVLEYKKSIPEREAYRKSLDAQIEKQRKELEKLRSSINKAEAIKQALDRFLLSIS